MVDARDLTRVATGASGLTFLTELQLLVWDMRWFIAFAVVLIVVDFKFGKEKSQVHHIPFRRSRAVRRTVNKFLDYMCWLMFAGVMGRAFGEPYGIDKTMITAIAMTIACICELDSIFQNYFEAKGMKFSFKDFVISLLKKKHKDVGEALDDSIQDGDESIN